MCVCACVLCVRVCVGEEETKPNGMIPRHNSAEKCHIKPTPLIADNDYVVLISTTKILPAFQKGGGWNKHFTVPLQEMNAIHRMASVRSGNCCCCIRALASYEAVSVQHTLASYGAVCCVMALLLLLLLRDGTAAAAAAAA